MDPGAVPGTSTLYGGETASTRVIKIQSSFGIVPPLSGRKTIGANNIASRVVAVVIANGSGSSRGRRPANGRSTARKTLAS